jgi:hypothetical protein
MKKNVAPNCLRIKPEMTQYEPSQCAAMCVHQTNQLFYIAACKTCKTAAMPYKYEQIQGPIDHADLEAANNLSLQEHRPTFVKPEVFPAAVGHQVASPTMGNLVKFAGQTCCHVRHQQSSKQETISAIELSAGSKS